MEYIKLFQTHDPEYLTYINSSDKKMPNLCYCEDIEDLHLNKIVDPRIIAIYDISNINQTVQLCSNISEVIEIEIDGTILPEVADEYIFTTEGLHTIKFTLADPTVFPANFFKNQYSYLVSCIIPNTINIIDESAFMGCNRLTNIIIPNNVRTINETVFQLCEHLINLNIPDSVISIGGYAFQNCISLTNVTIGNGLLSIEDNTFENCYALSNITIGNSVTNIGNFVFNFSKNLTSITSLATTAPTIQQYTFSNMNSNGTLFVPSGSTGYDLWLNQLGQGWHIEEI